MFNKIFLISLILSISLSNCVKLDNICTTFKHGGSNGILVNSIHKIQFDIKLEKISHYLVDEDVDYKTIFTENPHLVQTANGIRISHNKIFREVFNENFLNLSKNSKRNRLAYYTTQVMALRNQASNLQVSADFEKWELFENSTLKKISNADDFIFMNTFLLHDRIANKDPNTIESFKKLILNLKNLIKPGQKFVFENQTPDYIYEKASIFSFIKFIDSDQPAIITHIYLPFNNPNYVKSNCLPIEKLPVFYDINSK